MSAFRVALITTSRADLAGLQMVADALHRRSHGFEWVTMGESFTTPPVEHAAATMSWVGARLRKKEFDWVIVHGDRSELVAATLAANMAGLPIAHLGGGDITEGSADECYRHAISKLSHIHFPTHAAAADRLRAMGERWVYPVGEPETDRLFRVKPMGGEETWEAVGLGLMPPDFPVGLVLLHPDTINGEVGTYLASRALVVALEAISSNEMALVLVGPNADQGAKIITDDLRSLAHRRDRTVYLDSLLDYHWLSAMHHAAVLVGNSSCGIYEAPVLGLPVVNIGDRQKGRPRPHGVFSCGPVPGEIEDRIRDALRIDRRQRTPPSPWFGSGNVSDRIVEILEQVDDPQALRVKQWGASPYLTRRLNACSPLPVDEQV